MAMAGEISENIMVAEKTLDIDELAMFAVDEHNCKQVSLSFSPSVLFLLHFYEMKCMDVFLSSSLTHQNFISISKFSHM